MKFDYKSIIEHLRTSMFSRDNDPLLCAEAATAIETLLAERDAAMEDIKAECGNCKYTRRSWDEEPCVSCGAAGECRNWQWRNQTKGDTQ